MAYDFLAGLKTEPFGLFNYHGTLVGAEVGENRDLCQRAFVAKPTPSHTDFLRRVIEPFVEESSRSKFALATRFVGFSWHSHQRHVVDGRDRLIARLRGEHVGFAKVTATMDDVAPLIFRILPLLPLFIRLVNLDASTSHDVHLPRRFVAGADDLLTRFKV